MGWKGGMAVRKLSHQQVEPSRPQSHAKLLAVVAATMVAFASNSLLTRAGVRAGADPMAFAALRVISGAVTLLLLATFDRPALRQATTQVRARVLGALSLAIYLVGFSLALVWVDAGIGTLILFGTVQLCLFGGAVAVKEPTGLLKWLGMATAMAGLILLLWPTKTGVEGVTSVWGPVAMVVGAVGWAGYTWLGRTSGPPLAASAINFAVVAVGFAVWWASGLAGAVSGDQVVYAVLSGALASGVGYAMWFWILPQITASTAGVAQLSVPVIAVFAGALFLGETLVVKTLIAAAIVLGGIAIATIQRTRGSNGS